ncbi:2-isopropylmalate synthase [Desulfovibrio sp. OttesenSCG-928-C14]|nr:2-isopropylmalate synthase [Desulfovibrio sp. OttesenSCG-928-C14]
MIAMTSTSTTDSKAEAAREGAQPLKQDSAPFRRPEESAPEGENCEGRKVERLIIFDTTLRDGEQSPGATMNLQEKISMARQLESLGVDVIEAGFPASSQGDFEAVRAIAENIRHSVVAGLARCTKSDIDRAWEAIKDAARPRIHIFLATSPIHMVHKLRKTPQEVLEAIRVNVAHASTLCQDVEFSAEDASRSDPDFLVQAFNEAVLAGASTINIPDTVGYAQPEEFGALVRYVIAKTRPETPQGRQVVFSVHCHNDLGMGVACSLAAVRAGARQVEGTIAGIGERAGNAALEEIVMALHVRRDYYGCLPRVNTEQLYPSCRTLSRIIGQPIPANKPIVGDNAFAHESGIHQDGVMKNRETYEIMSAQSIGRQDNAIIIGKHSGRNALRRKIEALGYNLGDEEINLVFAALKRLADRKEEIYEEDIEALILEEVYRMPDVYRLEHLSVQSGGKTSPPTAVLVMEVEKARKQHVAFGTGPVDAVFKAVCEAIGRSPRLKRFQINALTEGTDAQGEVTVRIEENGIKAVGRGADSDIINASARALLNAMNRLVKKEKENGSADENCCLLPGRMEEGGLGAERRAV